MSKYFAKNGVDTNFEKMYSKVKQISEKLQNANPKIKKKQKRLTKTSF
jgi:hypothetical protein